MPERSDSQPTKAWVEALRRIGAAAKHDLKQLSLMSLGLTAVPAEIGNLTNLTELDLSGNRLSTLPPEIANLSNLTKLRLSGNKIAPLPGWLWRLTNLTEFTIANTGLVSVPPEIVSLSNLTKLDLSGNKLSVLPPEIGGLSNLTELRLQGTGLKNLPPEISKLAKLTTLFYGGNQVSTLPPEIGGLANLTRLYLTDNHLASLPPVITNLTNLTDLYLSSNNLTALPPAIGNLTRLSTLYLNENQISALPPEIGSLVSLTRLHLSHNQISVLPPEIGDLSSLTELSVSNNPLSTLPPEAGKLSSLTSLWLNGNLLTALPSEIGKLSNLTVLTLSGNHLTTLPSEIGSLSNLTKLSLSGNRLSVLPPETGKLLRLASLWLDGNELSALPPEVGDLCNLADLRLQGNRLSSLPPEIGKLTGLTTLYLDRNQLSVLPQVISNLTNLTKLYLSGNNLTSLPPGIDRLTNLTKLDLGLNQLSSLPLEIGKLTNLTKLELGLNKLTSLPHEIRELHKLTELYLYDNQLSALPVELGRLEKLEALSLDGNPLTSPPPEVVAQGTKAVLRFLKEQLKKGRRQWVSKLVLVGEGAVGKSELLRSLRNEEFAGDLETTHGIEVRPLELAHPFENRVTMLLNCWDFGGQEIYHATHQFFLTQRSLFVLVWSARLGWEPCKLYYWLDAIKARAPDAPVVIVATWTDERSPDLPLAEIIQAYPQVKGHLAVSNKKRTGIEELRTFLAGVAAKLPLMGEEWPDAWLSAAEEVRASQQRHVSPEEFGILLGRHGVTEEDQSVLGRVLHDLGDVLWFQDDSELNDLVVLKPQWVTEYISRVLESEDVIGRDGIFTRPHMDQLWKDLDPEMRGHFLRLMERFDLSYRTLDPQNREISLVVERLPLDPADYEDEWQKPLAQECCRTITMKYRLNTVPAGIPTWFIARAHRFTTHTHWRNGALFADGKDKRHLALVRSYPHERCVELSARGPMPQSFFALLRDGFELTLARFPGLDMTRTMPCPGHDAKPCEHEFKYADLEARLVHMPPRETIECPVGLADVSVPKLVFGLSWQTTGAQVLARLDRALSELTEVRGDQRLMLSKQEALLALTQREFTRLFSAEQSRPETNCPNVFTLRPLDRSDWLKGLVGQKVELQLYCQCPGKWHPTEKDGRYVVADAPKWLKMSGPYIAGMVKVLKYVAPLAGPWVGMAFPEYEKLIQNDIRFMTELVEILPDMEESDEEKLLAQSSEQRGAEPAKGAALRAVRKLLDEKDPAQHWGGLTRVLTPEGHYLWLCEYHALEFSPKPVRPDSG